jgi:alkylation response protein AidB-like acyl-CoA dehydrogenase
VPIDFTLTDEQRALREEAREFARDEILPAARRVHAGSGASRNGSSPSPWETVRPVVEKGAGKGYMTMLVPERYGGGGRSMVDLCVVMEELGAADVGIAATYFNNTATAARIIEVGGTPKQQERLFGAITSSKTPLLTGALNEPDVAGSDLYCPTPDASMGIQTLAEHDGDGHYVINGQKARWCGNAGLSSHYFVVARTDPTKPAMASLCVFVVENGTEGLVAGEREPLMGWETGHNATVRLNGVRVPEENLLGGEEGAAARFFPRAIPYIITGFAACYVGLARAAYELAADYAKRRTSWGLPIIAHQAVALKLADMYVDAQTARLLTWDAARAADTGSPEVIIKAQAAKTHAVDVAIKNAENAVRILGGYGVTAESEAARLLRDAWCGYPVDGTRDLMRLGITGMLHMAPQGAPG